MHEERGERKGSGTDSSRYSYVMWDDVITSSVGVMQWSHVANWIGKQTQL